MCARGFEIFFPLSSFESIYTCLCIAGGGAGDMWTGQVNGRANGRYGRCIEEHEEPSTTGRINVMSTGSGHVDVDVLMKSDFLEIFLIRAGAIRWGRGGKYNCLYKWR